LKIKEVSSVNKDKSKPISYNTIIRNKTLGKFFEKNEEDEEELKRIPK
jgi:hypothetical protein